MISGPLRERGALLWAGIRRSAEALARYERKGGKVTGSGERPLVFCLSFCTPRNIAQRKYLTFNGLLVQLEVLRVRQHLLRTKPLSSPIGDQRSASLISVS